MKHFGFADAVNTSAMQLVGKSLVDFLGVWPELEALSLALISFSTIFSDPLRFHSSSFTCQLTISRNSCGNFFSRTETNI